LFRPAKEKSKGTSLYRFAALSFVVSEKENRPLIMSAAIAKPIFSVFFSKSPQFHEKPRTTPPLILIPSVL